MESINVAILSIPTMCILSVLFLQLFHDPDTNPEFMDMSLPFIGLLYLVGMAVWGVIVLLAFFYIIGSLQNTSIPLTLTNLQRLCHIINPLKHTRASPPKS